VGDENSLEGFDAPDEAREPGLLCGKSRLPDGEDLGTLVDALEAFFGFGDGFNRSDPKFFSAEGVKSDANALPAVLHAEHLAGECATEAEILRAFGRFKKTVGLGGSEEVDNRFDANGDGFPERLFELQTNLTGDFASVGGRAERETFREREHRGGGAVFCGELEFVFANELNIVGRSGFDVKGTAGKSEVFLQIKSFIVGLSASGAEEQNAEGVAGQTVVAEKSFEAGLFDESLLVVNRRDRAGHSEFRGFSKAGVVSLGPALNGVDEGRGRGTKIERGKSATIGGFKQDLIFG